MTVLFSVGGMMALRSLPFLPLVVLWMASIAHAETEVEAFYIGHSLTSDIPDLVKALAEDAAGVEFSFKEQNIPGAPLRWQWNEGKSHEGEPQFQGRYDEELATGDFNALVVTDSVPRGGEELEAESVDYLARFAEFAREHRPDIRIFYYETWHHITSGTPENSEYDTASPRRTLRWRERLDADRPMWESIVEQASERAGDIPITIIPAGQALAKFDDLVRAGKVPGIARTEDYFDDAIHVNPYGKYLVACVHFATLFGRSPVGLTADVKDRWGRSYWDTPNWQKKQWAKPDPEAVRIMQEVAWETVAGHPKTGVPASARR